MTEQKLTPEEQEFNDRILGAHEEFEAHPERFHLEFRCKGCGREWSPVFPKAEVERWIAGHGHGTRIVEVDSCEQCPEEEDDEWTLEDEDDE